MREPDIKGPNAKAWALPKPTKRAPAVLASWAINYPGVHAFWEWWTWSLVTLEDLPNTPMATKHYPEARYEVVCLAVNPDACPPDVDGTDPIPYLTPPDLVKQFHVDEDTEAIALVANSIVHMVNGSAAPPDVDYHRWWSERIDEAAKHARGET